MKRFLGLLLAALLLGGAVVVDTGDVLTYVDPPEAGKSQVFKPGSVQVVRVPVTFADFVDVAGVGLALTDYVIPAGSILPVSPGVLVTTPFNDSGGTSSLDFVVGVDAEPTNSIADANKDGTPVLSLLTLASLTGAVYLPSTDLAAPVIATADTPVSFVLPAFADDGTTGEAVGILFLIPPAP